MLITPQLANNNGTNNDIVPSLDNVPVSRVSAAPVAAINNRYRIISTLLLGAAVMMGITGCGQKGALYLVDTDSQMVSSSSDVLDSTSNPQDAAFAGIDDDDYQKTRYLEQKQVLPDISDGPNDY